LDEEKKAAFIERMRIAREKRAAGELPPKKTVKGRPSNPLKPKKKAKRKAVKAPKKSPIAKPVQKVDKKPTIPVEQNLIKIDKEPKQGDPIIRQQPLSLAEKKKLLERARFLEREKDRLHAMREFEYFLDTFVYIENKEMKCAEKLSLWPMQREVLPAFMESDLLACIKTRQCGVTWVNGAAYALWLALKYDLHLTVVISASEDHAKEFLDRVYFILDRLPDWFVTKKISTRTVLTLGFTKESVDPITKKKTTLESTIKSMPTIEMGAESKTPNLLIIDEAHTIRNVNTIFNSSYPGIEAAKGRVIIIANSVKNQSSPGWPWVRDFFMASKRGENRAKRLFMPWTVNPDRPPNFRELMEESGMDHDDVIMHFPETEDEAIQSASGSFFGNSLTRHKEFRKGITGYLRKNEEDGTVVFVEDKHGFLEIWEFPDLSWKNNHAVGSDVGAGLGGNYSVAYAKNRREDKFIMRMRSNRIDPDTWGIHLDDLSTFCGDGCVCCERDGVGISTINKLAELGTNQYVRMLPGKTGGAITKIFGWQESSTAKNEACGDLRTYFANTVAEVPDAILIDEAATFITHPNGQIKAETETKQDDCVIGAALTLQADKFMGAAVEVPRPEKEPDHNTLEYIAFKDRQECLEEAMGGGEYDNTEW